MVLPTPNQHAAQSLRTSGLLRVAVGGMLLSYRGAVIVIRSLANSNICRPGASPFRATKQHCYTTPHGAPGRPDNLPGSPRHALLLSWPPFGNIYPPGVMHVRGGPPELIPVCYISRCKIGALSGLPPMRRIPSTT